MIKYEFPLNERIRKFMRVEEIFIKIDLLTTSKKNYTEFSLFERLFELMLTASRSDLKVDLIQEIERQKVKLKSKSKTQANNNLMVRLAKIKNALEKAKVTLVMINFCKKLNRGGIALMESPAWISQNLTIGFKTSHL